MEQYFFKITHSYSHKNKLIEALSAHVHELDHMLIRDAATLETFKMALRKKCVELNREYYRCHPIEIQDSFQGGGILVSGSWTADFYPVRNAIELKDEFLQYHL